MRTPIPALLVVMASAVSPMSIAQETGQAVMRTEFIYETAPFPSCHASTLAQTRDGIIAAWFGGKHERSPDVGIWVSRRDARGWSPVVEVANGVQPNGVRHPCWNPVLFQPLAGPLLLFYKVGPSPTDWWGMLITSADQGRTWSTPQRLPEGFLGPIKNKPVQLNDGSLLCPSSTEHAGWRVHLERSPDLGKTWQQIGPINDGKEFGAIQPAILTYPSGWMQILCRSRQRRITESWSEDGGKTWSAMKATTLPNPSSGIDAVSLKDGRALLIYNHTERGRSPLNLAVSSDGKTWKSALVLETQPGEYSYPAIIQTSDGLVHVTYTWKRERIKYVVIDPKKLVLSDLPGSPG
jgi:predicted neuraminidase